MAAVVGGSAAYVEAVVRKKSSLIGEVDSLDEVLIAGGLGMLVGLTAPISIPAIVVYKIFW